MVIERLGHTFHEFIDLIQDMWFSACGFFRLQRNASIHFLDKSFQGSATSDFSLLSKSRALMKTEQAIQFGFSHNNDHHCLPTSFKLGSIFKERESEELK